METTPYEYIEKQNPHVRGILFTMLGVIQTADEGISCRMNWGIPFFYFRGSSWCYLAFVKKWNCVEIGFTRGHLLPNNSGILLDRGRNTVRSIAFSSLQDFYSREEAVREVIQEALLLDISDTNYRPQIPR